MPRMSESEYRAFLARVEAHSPEDCEDKPRHNMAEDEAELHREIMEELNRRGWLYFHSAMHKRTWRQYGEPDFEIFASRGRTFLIEAKTKRGKPSKDQLEKAAMARSLGHRWEWVRSLQQFMEVIQ